MEDIPQELTQMPYNLTNVTTNTTMTTMFQTANSFSEGVLGLGILLAVFVVSWASMGWFRNSQAYAAASFLTFITGVVLMAIEIVSGRVFLLCWVGFALASVFLIRSDN